MASTEGWRPCTCWEHVTEPPKLLAGCEFERLVYFMPGMVASPRVVPSSSFRLSPRHYDRPQKRHDPRLCGTVRGSRARWRLPRRLEGIAMDEHPNSPGVLSQPVPLACPHC